MAAYIERLRSPVGRALLDAGPPNGQVLGALAAGVAIGAILSSAEGFEASPWVTVGLTAFILTTLVSLADRDGWRIREALAYLGLRQRARWRRGNLPEDKEEASKWLADPANAGASGLERASVLIGADRWDEAAVALAQTEATDAQEHAALVRMRSTIAARTSGRVDQAAVRAAVEDLPEPEAKYQLLAAAWTQAWLDISAGRRWRPELARAAREFGAFQIPASARVLIAIEQLAAPIACVVALLLAAALSWYGSL
jgi:hypothetical protein